MRVWRCVPDVWNFDRGCLGDIETRIRGRGLAGVVADLPRLYHRNAGTVKRNVSMLTRQHGKESLLRSSEISKDHCVTRGKVV